MVGGRKLRRQALYAHVLGDGVVRDEEIAAFGSRRGGRPKPRSLPKHDDTTSTASPT